MATINPPNDKINTNAFTDGNGVVSMRRLLAFILTLTSIAFGVACIVTNKDWKFTLVATSIPLVASIILLFFTTWSDLGEVVDKIKK